MLRVYSTLEILHPRQRRKKERGKQTPQRTDDNDATPKKKNKSWKLKARKEAKNTEIIQGI
jgi:hypothetical protein